MLVNSYSDFENQPGPLAVTVFLGPSTMTASLSPPPRVLQHRSAVTGLQEPVSAEKGGSISVDSREPGCAPLSARTENVGVVVKYLLASGEIRDSFAPSHLSRPLACLSSPRKTSPASVSAPIPRPDAQTQDTLCVQICSLPFLSLSADRVFLT